ncbi:MAG: hypothetical protein ABIH46_14240, partial [Chloroflexota bacterium]
MKELTGDVGRRKIHPTKARMAVASLLLTTFAVAGLMSGCGTSEDQANTSEYSALERLQRE